MRGGRAEDDANLLSTMALLRNKLDQIHLQRRHQYGIPSGSKIGKVELFMAMSPSGWFNNVLNIESLKAYIDAFHIMVPYDRLLSENTFIMASSLGIRLLWQGLVL